MSEQVIGRCCGYDEGHSRHMVCTEFYLSASKGWIIPNRDEGGWEVPDAEKRRMGWRAKFYAKQRNQSYTDHSGDPYLFTEICPYCGGELPPVVIVPRKLLSQGDGSQE